MNANQIRAVAPTVDPGIWLPLLTAAAARFNIVGVQAEAAWLANAGHESAGFTVLEESLNYKWVALLGQWPRKFDPVTAVRVGRVDTVVTSGGRTGVYNGSQFIPTAAHRADQQSIANIAYAGRFGNDVPGDGWKFRGHGLFQLTFKDNYAQYAAAVNAPSVMNDPSLLSKPEHAASSAAWFWKSKGLSQVLASRGFDAVCIAINGGKIGLPERQQLYARVVAAT